MRLLLLSVFAIAACAQPVLGQPTSAPLRLATWNLEHLAEYNGSGCRPRTDADYAAMRAYVDLVDADIIAFQEVENEAAAERVFDPAKYEIVIERRVGSGRRTECRGMPGQFMNRQATGFAVRRGITFQRHADFTDLQAGGPDLRSAVDITLQPPGGEPIRLLSIHLKSGCFEGTSRGDCPRLFRQIPILERWIDARARAEERFAVMGDFNRWLGVSGDPVWAEWDDADPPNADLTLVSGDEGATCDRRYPHFIDNVVVDRLTAPAISGFHEWTHVGPMLSDHCLVSVEIAPS
ncbi:MAG TPA: endonuclease/exonuclease/phosphatase family protein [Vitreimonas sp.]|uniref:endonuclease/exonuclease/phosphatase family protein n=1 Tax=Vitreimonas sp. TaxID=3069702 RepID=UPI002D4C7E8C|nr:endonuclease/exonuclease/phosphatase family protein [Vitreimonas sp.]HYD86262.1 endonuclease/exonuclease/phosphatase family protein [Vitreimonas sp.]